MLKRVDKGIYFNTDTKNYELRFTFKNPKTGTKYTNRYKKLNNILKKVGVKKLGVGYHIFRHTTAANLEQNGVEASTIKDVLGNTTNVVLNNYLNQGVKRTQEVINLNSERIRKIITKQEIKKSVQEYYFRAKTKIAKHITP